MSSELLLIGSGAYGQFLKETINDLGLNLTVTDGQTVDFTTIQQASYVIIATPNYTHFDLVKRALQAKKSVLCEKPLVLSMEEMGTLYSLAKQQGCHVNVGFVLHHHPFYRLVKDLQQQLGPIQTMKVDNQATEGTLKPAWYWDKKLSGGWFMVSEIHWYHLFGWLTDSTDLQVEQAYEERVNSRTTATHSVIHSDTNQMLRVDHRLDMTYETASCKVEITYGHPDSEAQRSGGGISTLVIDDWVPRSLTLDMSSLTPTGVGDRGSSPSLRENKVDVAISKRTQLPYFQFKEGSIVDSRNRSDIYKDLIRSNIQDLLTSSSLAPRPSPLVPVFVSHQTALAAESKSDLQN